MVIETKVPENPGIQVPADGKCPQTSFLPGPLSDLDGVEGVWVTTVRTEALGGEVGVGASEGRTTGLSPIPVSAPHPCPTATLLRGGVSVSVLLGGLSGGQFM